jgi:hypothetical protein
MAFGIGVNRCGVLESLRMHPLRSVSALAGYASINAAVKSKASGMCSRCADSLYSSDTVSWNLV